MPYGLNPGAGAGGAGMLGFLGGPMGALGALSGLTSLFGGLFGGNPEQARLKQLGRLYAPGTLGQYRGEYLNQFMASPLWRQQMANTWGASNQFQADAMRRAAMMGDGSGLASIIPGLAGSLRFNLENQNLANAYANASREAQGTISCYGQALGGAALPASPWQTIQGGLGGLDQILLLNALRSYR